MTVNQRIAFIAISLLVAASVFSTNVQAQSNPIYFPYVVNDTQTSTELILTNASGIDATVTLAGYREDGSGFLVQNSVRVPAASQIVVGASVFGSLQGWVLGSSDVPGVLGNVRVSSRDGSAQDTTEPAQFDTVIVLPLVAQSYGASTEISVVNPTVFGTRVNLTVYDRAGKALAENDAPLSPFGMYRGTVAAIFGGDKDYSNASHVVARSIPLNIFSPVVDILGFEVVRGFTRIPDDPTLQKIFSRRDWAALPAVAVSAGASSLILPHAFRLTDWFCLIGLVNLTDSQQTATLTYTTATNPNAGVRSVSIPANGSIQMTATDLFGAGQDTGSVKVAGTGSLAGFLAVGTASGAGFAAAPVQSKGPTEFFFPSVDDTAPSFTGIALRNEGSSQAIVELFLISSQGATLGRKTELLLPQQKTVRLVREYFIEGLNHTGGYVFVRSSAPIFASAVMGIPDRMLGAFSAQPAFPGFAPAAQSLFAVRGRITDNLTGAAVAGVSVILSRFGYPDAITTTDGNGEYIFKNLAPGDYTVKDGQSGRMFAPVAFPLNTASKILDFTLFAIRGRITDNLTGAAVAGVSVTLSRLGYLDVTTTTDGNGEYIFKNLAPGDYVVKPGQSGRMFAPLNPLVRLEPASKILDFTRELAPAIGAVTVVTNDADGQKTAGNNPEPFAEFGTAEVSLRIDGSNFVNGQKIFFGSRLIPAGNVNFVDSRTVFVKLDLDSPEILAELSARGFYGSYNIAIGGQSPFDESRSNAVAFYVVPPVPVLISVTSASTGRADAFARYEVDSPGETLAVTGSGFRTGARLLFNGASALNSIEIDTKFISSSRLEAYLPPQALRFGGSHTLRVRNVSQLPEVSGEAVTFTVYNLRPEMYSFDPPAPTPVNPYGGSVDTAFFNFTINGSNFHPAASVTSADPGTLIFFTFIKGGKSQTVIVTPVFVSTNQVIVSTPIDFATSYTVVAVNATPGGGVSTAKQLTFTSPPGAAPAIRSIDPLTPSVVSAGSAGFNLTVYRDIATTVGFQPNAWVNFGTVRLDRIAGDTETITVLVPSFLVGSPGLAPITVTNPGTSSNTGGTSNRVFLTVQ